MIHPKAGARTLAIMLGVVAMTALLFAGSAGAASRGYRLHNDSNSTLQVIGASPVPKTVCTVECVRNKHPMDFEGRPADDWELKYFFGYTYAAELKYRILRTNGTVTYKIETSSFSNNSTCTVTPPSAGRCTASGLSLSFN